MGSWLKITDQSGAVENSYSYDAWGRPRNPNTWVLLPVSIANALVNLSAMQPRFDRGYTGHEHMAGFGLINMNGRLYDPYLQRFLSPDNFVQSPLNAQNYNRYTYCLNNPLMYTDPSGYTWGIFKPFVQAASWASKNVGTVLTVTYLAATAVACVFVPPLGGAMLGAYVGGLTANGGQLNAGKWNYKSSDTWLSIGFGAACGALGGYGLAHPGSVAVKCRWLVPGVGALGFNFDEDISFQWSTNAGGGGEIVRSEGGKDYNDLYALTQENLIGKKYQLATYGPDSYDCSAAVTTGIKIVTGENYVGIYNAPGLFTNYTHPTDKRGRGTLIFYDWTNDGAIDHVVTILNDQYMMQPSSTKGLLIRMDINGLDWYLQNNKGVRYYREINWPGWNRK